MESFVLYRIRILVVGIALALAVSGCTTNRNFYTGEDDLAYNEEFSIFNTIMLPVVVLGVVAIAYDASQGGGSNYSGASQSRSNYSDVSCKGYYCDYDSAWDFLPGSGEYRCRDTRNGQFVQSNFCSDQDQQDNWY